jgi:hypothetical protein
MKRILLATVAVLAATVAQAEAPPPAATVAVLAATVAGAEAPPPAEQTVIHVREPTVVYVKPGSAVPWETKRPFKTAISGDEELLVVHPGATNQHLMIVAKQPDGTLIASANVLMIDNQGNVVEYLRVIVTPFGQPSSTLTIHGGKTTTYQCASGYCIDASAAKLRNKGMGDADSLTVTTSKDGSTLTSKIWSTPPTPPR